MPKRRAKRAVKQSLRLCDSNLIGTMADQQAELQQDGISDQEVEHQIAATRTIRDIEIERLLTGLRLLHSNFNEQQLKTPVLKIFKENLSNLSLVRNENDGQFEVDWKDRDGKLSMSHADERNIYGSVLQQISLAFPGCSVEMPALGGFEFSSKAVETSLLSAANLHNPGFVMEEQSETQMLGLQDAQTPGVNAQRLSIGMTPKTLRLPKRGEMLLSVRGSPLGVYKEDNMEAIHESEESL